MTKSKTSQIELPLYGRRKAARGGKHRKFEVTALFAGVGGLELGLEQAGHRATSMCEIDAEAATVLAKRFPRTSLVRDVCRTDEVIEAVSKRSDLLTAGFPCTDLSQVGATQGFAGGRSSLIRDALRILKKREFGHVLIENVPNWRSLHKGVYLNEVVSALERMGYAWAYRTIDARAFGVPQRRLRLFLYATREGDPREVLFNGDKTPDDTTWSLRERAHGFYWTEGSRGIGWGEDCVPTLKGGSSIGIPAPPAIVMPNLDIVTPDIRDAERLQGLPADWTNFDESIDGGVFKQRRRWMLVGNAVNVEVAAWVGEQLARPTRAERELGAPLKKGDSWPAAAWGDGGKRWAHEIGAWPVRERPTPLAKFLQHPGAPLSERATNGFYERYKKSRLVVKADFAKALARHLKRMRGTQRRAA